MSWVKLIATVAALAALLLTSAAQAGFVSNYSNWKDVPSTAKASYAAGMYDALLLPRTGDTEGIALAIALDRCASALKLTPTLIAEAMTRYWEQHSDRWGDAAAVVFYNSVAQTACLEHVNKERRKAGLVEWPKH